MTNSLPDAMPATRAQANLDLANELLTSCFDPVRPEAFERFCIDERCRFVFAGFAEAFPNAAFRVEWIVADERRVVVGGRTQATHEGTWRGVEATGQRIDIATISSLAIEDGWVIDVSVVSDSLTLAEQIGAVDPFAPPACQLFDRR